MNRNASETAPNRRALLIGVGALLSSTTLSYGQNVPPRPAPPPLQPSAKFGFEDVVRRAREMSVASFDARPPSLPDSLSQLDYDTWRDIRFRADRALLNGNGGPFRMQMFHPGFLYRRTVTVNVVRDGIPTPVPYAANLFDYGRSKFDKPFPVNLGFAGFRLHYPLNDPTAMDELIAFLGGSYFRFLGRGQRYGLSARGLAINVGGRELEEFPFFREFWVEQPGANAERITVYALLDSESVSGAYQFIIYPGVETVVDVTCQLFTRKAIARLGVAPLTSMFYYGESDRRQAEDYRPELHDSDGLLIHSGSGEWIWRPLRNPRETENSVFIDKDIRGFGLMQRDRIFEHYQDLDLAYELRPSYWVEPRDGWGEGRIELVEIPTTDESNDNIVACWVPNAAIEAGQNLNFNYVLRAMMNSTRLNPGGYALNTYRAKARALGSTEIDTNGTTRFIIDFVGGDLPYFLKASDQVQVVPTTTNGTILRTFIIPNPKTQGFRASIDVQLQAGQSTDLRAFLRSGPRALTETWTVPWKAE